MAKRGQWQRNADHILTCEHENPLHEDCTLCMMRDEYDKTDRQIRMVIFVFFVLIAAAMALGWLS